MISVKIGCFRSSLFPSDASAIYSVTVYVHLKFSYNRFRNKNGVVLIVTKERIVSRTVLFHRNSCSLAVNTRADARFVSKSNFAS